MPLLLWSAIYVLSSSPSPNFSVPLLRRHTPADLFPGQENTPQFWYIIRHCHFTVKFHQWACCEKKLFSDFKMVKSRKAPTKKMILKEERKRCWCLIDSSPATDKPVYCRFVVAAYDTRHFGLSRYQNTLFPRRLLWCMKRYILADARYRAWLISAPLAEDRLTMIALLIDMTLIDILLILPCILSVGPISSFSSYLPWRCRRTIYLPHPIIISQISPTLSDSTRKCRVWWYRRANATR